MQEKLNVDEFDKNISAGDDFFRHINSNWMANNPIPEDEYRWSAFNEITIQNEIKLNNILEELAITEDLEAGSDSKKLANFYKDFLDTVKLNSLGIAPLRPFIQEIEKVSSVQELMKITAKFHRSGISPFWSCFIASDDKQSDTNIFRLFQAGLSLPDRDYYFKDDARSKEIVEKYKKHIAEMVKLSGLEFAPDEFAENVFEIEKALAEKSLNSEQLRDYEKLYFKLSFEELQNLTASLDWQTYLTELGDLEIDSLIVSVPEFFEQVEKVITGTSMEKLQQYLLWHLISRTAGVLTEDFSKESFHFNETVLNGTDKMKPRWRRAVRLVDENMGEILGQKFVARYFNETAKERMAELIANLVEAFGERVKKLSWMTEETKQKALSKLSKMSTQIGYPDVWKDYSALEIVPGDLCGNLLRANQFQWNLDLQKLGQPVDKKEWHMTPPTVNAYCSFWFNQIVFPAGILQPVFFDVEADDAINYGGIGVVIGHEITHGFDDQGKKYDENGSMNSWWTDEDTKNFEAKAQEVSKLYSTFEVEGGHKVNGELTLGENIADLGGLAIAYDALQISFQKNDKPELIDGLTPEQRFFGSYARVWRGLTKPEALEKQIKTDPHSPAEWRVNGALKNVDEFYQAFNVSETDKIYLPEDQRITLW